MTTRTILRIVLITALTAVVVVGGYWLYQKLDAGKQDYNVEITPSNIPADGVSSALVEIQILSRFGNKLNVKALPHAPKLEITEGKDLVRVIPLSDSLRYRLVSNFETGAVVVHVTIPGALAPIEVGLQLTASLADANHNGYPDVMDLTSETDRTAFRRWFTTIAVGQLTHMDDRWNDRDCAGLLRYCYREALKRHDSLWKSKRLWQIQQSIPDVAKYNYPNVPLVGTAVFNAGTRQQQSGDTAAAQDENLPPPLRTFHTYAEAARLKDNALQFLSRNPADALPGDVIFYLNDTEADWPYHSMIYLGGHRTVYHTGPDGKNPGIVKTLTLAQLGQHPNPRWHPVQDNPYFLGFYRWKILL